MTADGAAPPSRTTCERLGHADILSTARYAQPDTADLAQGLLELEEGSA
jgi:hypothetical protein